MTKIRNNYGIKKSKNKLRLDLIINKIISSANIGEYL